MRPCVGQDRPSRRATEKDGERVQIESCDQWRGWLEENHDRDDGIWLVRFKKHRSDKYVSYNDMVE
jgi:hypothetical protein